MLVGSIGYFVGSIAFIVFFGILLTDRHNVYHKSLLYIALFISSIWSASMSYQAIMEVDLIIPQVLEFLKGAAWLAFLFKMTSMTCAPTFSTKGQRIAILSVLLVIVIMVFPVVYGYFLKKPFPLGTNFDFLLATHLLLSVIGLVLLEQLFRNSRHEQRQIIKHMCLGLGGMFLYDFYMYSDGLLYKRVDLDLWQARGFINALIVPVMGLSIVRDPLWTPEVFISRRVVFHTTTLLASALYLLLMGTAGYYVREYGGSWGHIGQSFLLFLTILFLLLGLFSKRIRSFLKVSINKHFYPYKYDYREEWLRFINTLSASDATSNPNLTTIKAVAQIIDSPGGMLWLKNDNEKWFECVEAWNMPGTNDVESFASTLPKFLEDNEFVISLDEYSREPEVYSRLGQLELSAWMIEFKPWLIVPLINIDKLIGFVVLDHAAAHLKHFNWEDSDLLKTVARQAASYIAHSQAISDLAVAKQFEAFNRLSTYAVHDIKNLVTQLSLITSNAERHMSNPLFMKDVTATIDNSVKKMNALINRLKNKDNNDGKDNNVDVIHELRLLMNEFVSSGKHPIPEFHFDADALFVKADKEKLSSVFSHIIQNAQDATDANGEIQVVQTSNAAHIRVEIQDNGCGMSEDFIRNHLFQPFKTTKGDAGMGIGVFESREIIKSLGGDVSIESVVNLGTKFSIVLPRVNKKIL